MTKILYSGVVFAMALLAGSGFSVLGEEYQYEIVVRDTTSDLTSSVQQNEEGKTAIVFLGDILLARKVEHYMDTYSIDYPFLRQNPFRTDQYVVANFESSVPAVHRPTPFYNMSFSTRADFVPVLKAHGFTHMSVANNHSLDSGVVGFASTQEALLSSGVTPFGVPRAIHASSTTYLTLGSTTIAIIGLETLSFVPKQEELSLYLDTVSRQSDMQIVYIHWGVEYAGTHSRAQAEFARMLISLGVDAIIGHHPHVVQDIEVIDGVPVFYSLGNYIFDQYFSSEVQEGLLLTLTLDEQHYSYALTPVTSADMQSAPRPMTREEKSRFLSRLAQKSEPSIAEMIRAGTITLPR
jgi:hypothetical protein